MKSELRIGNWIADRGGKQWQISYWEYPNKVASIDPYIGEISGHYIYGHPLTEDVDFLQPIQLTPKILEKCGAEKFSSGDNTYTLHGILISYTDCRNVFTHNGKELKYLHKLQNYIYELMDVELTYQP